MSTQTQPAMIEQLLRENVYRQDPDAQIHVRRTSLGWLRLHIVSNIFRDANTSDRERQIDTILSTIGVSLGSFPFERYELLTPTEVTEAQDRIPEPVQIPLWSEILMAPDPETPAPIEDDVTRRPFIVTFYSFKGGVGRTTALGFVALTLVSSGYRVVLVDFDLEAPGLSFLFSSDSMEKGQKGLLDYIYQRYLTPDLNTPEIRECVQFVPLNTRGELFIVPAGEYDEGYIHRLADLDLRFLYQRTKNPFHQLFEDIRTELDPDVILIDARTGFNEMAAVALFDQADLGVICFLPTEQSFAGLQWVVQAADKQRKYRGIPDLRFVLTPIPPVASIQKEAWMTRTYEWIADNWSIPQSLTVEDICYQVAYNPNISTLAGMNGDLPPGLIEPYAPIADAIKTSLPPHETFVPAHFADYRRSVLRELEFRAATAEEMLSTQIPEIFQRTSDFPKFLNERTWLVRGAKGTGKSLLFRLFIEQPEAARRLASTEIGQSRILSVAGHGPRRIAPTLLGSDEFRAYERRLGPDAWPDFWRNYAVLQIYRAIHQGIGGIDGTQHLSDDLLLAKIGIGETVRREDIIEWLIQRASIPHLRVRASDELETFDRLLIQAGQRIWLFYDELDSIFQQEYKTRRLALEALFGWWIEIGSSLRAITPKIFLREDIWSKLNFTNKAHFSGRFVQLRWEEEDLWRLILRHAMGSSPTLSGQLREQTGLEIERLDTTETEQLRQVLQLLWSERMGRGNKAYTHNWVRNRISDGKNVRFPRSLIQLMQRATEIERQASERSSYESVLRPRSLIEALPFVSEQRVAEVRNEYPEFVNYLDRLEGERSPIPLESLSLIWQLEGDTITTMVASMVEAGVLQPYSRRPEETGRYTIVELYLYGLRMTRYGQR